jgi:acrylyl-CoA reductase (NADPH)
MKQSQSFSSYLVSKDKNGKTTSSIVTRTIKDLPPGDVIIKVAYSSLNYKDALSATGNPGVTKNYPHVPGIDVAGTVVSSQSVEFNIDDKVLVTGYDLGSNTDGGFSEYVRVPSKWVVPLPKNISLIESMILGTAGFTAAIGVQLLLENGLHPEMGEVLVTGATGGVASVAVAILASEGFSVVASTGKKDAHEFLKTLGAHRIINRSMLNDTSGHALLKSAWAGGIDTVGGNILTTLLKSTKQHGCVAACGVVAGQNLDLTVFPFILRGVRLLGIDSARWPKNSRLLIWQKLANEWKPKNLDNLSQIIRLKDLDEYITRILKGKIRGRIVVKI